MFVHPWIYSDGEWSSVQAVWHRWQALNVGVLAFVSSLIAFNISLYIAEKQRQRDFQASKAFLPDALSQITTYLKSSAKFLVSEWSDSPKVPVTDQLPKLSRDYKRVFQDCIRHAEPQVGDCLARVLMRLQVHTSRLNDYREQKNSANWIGPSKLTTITYLYRVGELQAWVNRLFPFARSLEALDDSPLQWADFKQAYANLDLWPDDIWINDRDTLEGFTKRAIRRADPFGD